MLSSQASSIVDGLLQADRRSIARAISIIDNNEKESRDIIQAIFPRTGRAKTIGLTGSAGAGKSTLIGKLIPELHGVGYNVAVLAVDPTSPITGGAILGDRVRMQSVTSDDKVFMRSIGSRGSYGGISRSLRNIVRVLDAAGYDLILVESVGAGQVQTEISRQVDVTAVVFTPYTGDHIQNIKAGLTEVGNVCIVNKADLQGAGALYQSLLEFLSDSPKKPRVVKVSAKAGKGIRELVTVFHEILRRMNSSNQKENERRKLGLELRDMILNAIEQKVSAMLDRNNDYLKAIERLANKQTDPYRAMDEVIRTITW
ncbi:MAG: methylmalonyl Co-A mutase-associated GTPase MeaB [Thermoproteota archaeon]|nr:methylmalonyl Co-A mutase-associated GTPase MeaB [Thermoproteota archaeon]